MKPYPLFITAGKEMATYEKHVPAPFLRKKFSLKKSKKNYKTVVSGLGFYKLFVNGKEITKGFLAPYISNPDDMVYFDEYDITDLLNDGENVIGAILGNGMENCNGGAVWDFHIAKFRSAPKFALRIYEDDEILLDTDESWKCADSPIFFDDMRSGCFYDARNEIPHWADTDFDDSKWKNAIYAEIPRGECRICEAEPITVQQEIKPVKITKCILPYHKSNFDTRRSDAERELFLNNEPEHQTCKGDEEGYLFDFGVNTAGIWKLKVKGKKGQEIILQTVEYFAEDGNIQVNSFGCFYPTGYGQRDIYICKGEGEETFIPSFTYKGGRYCFVIGITEEQATESLLTYLELHSDFEERGGFECSDELTNKLQEITMRSAKSNFFYFPTDCPHREKNGWTGDAASSAEYMTMNFATEKSYTEWARNICKAVNDIGQLPGIVPTAGWGYHWGNGPAWDRIIVYLPYYTYIYRGDKRIAEESIHGIMRYLNYLTTKENENGLFAFGLGDWCPMNREAGDYVAPLELTDSVMVMSICEKASYLFGEMNMPLQKAFADGLYEKTRKNIREHLIDFNTMTAAGNCQTSQAICIFYNVFEKSEKKAAFEKLVKLIKEKDDHIDCGYLGCRVIFHVLAMNGEAELAYKMITRKDYPSFVYPIIKYGSTSLWEQYFDRENSSVNHHFFGDVSNFFIKRIAGLEINPLRRNENEYYVHPSFIETLDNAKAYYNAVAGKISVEWKREKDLIKIKIDAPENTKGTIYIPDGYEIKSENRGYNGLRIIPVTNETKEIFAGKV